jgi:hypothetical protein
MADFFNDIDPKRTFGVPLFKHLIGKHEQVVRNSKTGRGIADAITSQSRENHGRVG